MQMNSENFKTLSQSTVLYEYYSGEKVSPVSYAKEKLQHNRAVNSVWLLRVTSWEFLANLHLCIDTISVTLPCQCHGCLFFTALPFFFNLKQIKILFFTFNTKYMCIHVGWGRLITKKHKWALTQHFLHHACVTLYYVCVQQQYRITRQEMLYATMLLSILLEQ